MKNLYALTAKLLILLAFLGLHLPKVKAQTPYTISGITFLDYGGNKTFDDDALRHPALTVSVYASQDTVIDQADTQLGSVVSAFDGSYEITVTPDIALDFQHFLIEIAEADLFTGSIRNTTVLPKENSTTANVSFVGQPVACYAAADQQNALIFVNRISGFYALYDVGFGVNDIETMAFDLGGNDLFAVNRGTLGTIDLTNGEFTVVGTIGEISGAGGDINVLDADGLAFDPFTGILYAMGRVANGQDYLFLIDPKTGEAIKDAFGVGVDYVAVAGDGIFQDIDDIAINPADGKLYGVNSGGTISPDSEEYLVRIDKRTGATEIIATLTHGGQNIQDVEGFGFTNFGLLVASTGSQSKYRADLGYEVRNSMYEVAIDANGNLTGELLRISLFEDPGREGQDVEGCDCLIAPANLISGEVYVDINTNGENNEEEGLGEGIKIKIYVDTDNDGMITEADELVDSVFTDANGQYSWSTAANVDLILEVDPSTAPEGFFSTDDGEEPVGLGCCFGGVNEPNVDFGFFTQVFPVELIAFDAKYVNKNTQLTWATASEINSHYFEIQRSQDGRVFDALGKVDASGNSTSTIDYHFEDKAVNLLGINKVYYRLRQVDLDGTWSYSPIVELDIPSSDLGLNIYPNPVSNVLTIQNGQPNGQDIELQLIDVRGKQIRFTFIAPAQKINWDMSDLARGVYYLRAKQGEVLSHQKIVVE